jgi:hypothetical protein
MAAQGYRRFVDLDRDACERFLASMATRPGKETDKPLKSGTLQKYANLLTRLYLQGAKFPDVAIADPFPGIGKPVLLYIKGPQTRRVQSEAIARLQDLMLGWIIGRETDTGDHAARERIALGANAIAPFSHDCLNPLAGTASGSTAGRVCRHFGGCLRCPGLVIPIDAEHMARILQAKSELERARERLDRRRFEFMIAVGCPIRPMRSPSRWSRRRCD